LSPVRDAEIWGKPELTRHRFLSEGEYGRLLEVAPEPMRAHYATLALCGLRVGELIALPPAHVRLPTHIHVGLWGDWAPKGYPRSERGVRDVPVHRTQLLPLLEEYAEQWAGAASFFVHPGTGRPWLVSAFGRTMARDVAAAGLVAGQRRNGKRQPDGITRHTLRHTFASWLGQRDVQLVKIAQLLGDTIDTVERHYAHLLPTDLDRSVNRLFT